MNKIEHFITSEHTNDLYKKEAISSIYLTKEVADKINELVDAINGREDIDLKWKHEIEGTVHKGVIFMKDNLINSLHDLFILLQSNGDLNNIISDAVLTDVSTLKKKTFGTLNAFEFGAIGDGIQDDTKALQNAIDSLEDFETLLIPNGTFLCDSLSIKKDNVKIVMYGCLKQKANSNKNLLTVTGKNVQLDNLTLTRDCTMYGVSNDDLKNIGLLISECKNVFIDNIKVKNFNVGIDIHSDKDGCAYVEIKNPYIVAHECIRTSGESWTNEMHVIGGRLSIHETYSDYTGSAYANLNGDCFRFTSVCMEGNKVDRKVKGFFANSSFIGCRFEGTNKSGVDIEVNGDWNLFLHNRDMGLNIIDEGTGNNFLDFSTFKFNSAIATKTSHFKSTEAENKINLSWQMPLLLVDASEKSATVSTPQPTSRYEKGVEMTVKKVDDSVNTVYVYFRGGEADGISDTVLRAKGEAITFISDGEKWHIKNWYKPQ